MVETGLESAWPDKFFKMSPLDDDDYVRDPKANETYFPFPLHFVRQGMSLLKLVHRYPDYR